MSSGRAKKRNWYMVNNADNSSAIKTVYGQFVPRYTSYTYNTLLEEYKRDVVVLLVNSLKEMAESGDKEIRALYLNFLEFIEDTGMMEEEHDEN